VGRHQPEPGLMSAAVAGGTGTQAVRQGGAGRGEWGVAGAAPVGRGWGWAGRSLPGVEEAAATGGEEAWAQPGRGERGAGAQESEKE
jgi:hypothetical protein